MKLADLIPLYERCPELVPDNVVCRRWVGEQPHELDWVMRSGFDWMAATGDITQEVEDAAIGRMLAWLIFRGYYPLITRLSGSRVEVRIGEVAVYGRRLIHAMGNACVMVLDQQEATNATR